MRIAARSLAASRTDRGHKLFVFRFQEKTLPEMRVMTIRAMLNILSPVSFFAEILRFVVTLDTCFEHRLAQETGQLTAVHFVAHHTLTRNDRFMSLFHRGKLRMASSACVCQVFARCHLVSNIVAGVAFPCQHWIMNDREPRRG